MDTHHGDDVVEEVAAELAEAAGLLVAAPQPLGQPRGHEVDGDPEQQQDADTWARRY